MLHYKQSFMTSLPLLNRLSRMLSTRPEIKQFDCGRKYFELSPKKIEAVIELLEDSGYKLATHHWIPDGNLLFYRKKDKEIALFYDGPCTHKEETFQVDGDIEDLYACDALFEESKDDIGLVLENTQGTKEIHHKKLKPG